MIKSYVIQVLRALSFKLFAKIVFRGATSILRDEKVEYWLDFGTLLGGYRSETFIRKDYDIDLAVISIHKDRIMEIFLQNGYKLVDLIESDFGHFTIGFIKYGVMLDIYGYKTHQNSLIECLIQKGDRFFCLMNDLEGLKMMKFEGMLVSAPKNIREWLGTIYGVNFEFPDPNYKGSLNISRELPKDLCKHFNVQKLVIF